MTGIYNKVGLLPAANEILSVSMGQLKRTVMSKKADCFQVITFK